MRRIQQVHSAAVDHRSPTRRWWLHAQPEETQRRFRQDRAGHTKRGLHQERGERGRQHVTRQDAERAGAKRPGRGDVFELARPQHLPAHQARVTNPADHGECENDVDEAGSQHRDERDREQHARKRHQDIHDAADDLIDVAAVIPRDRTDGHTDDRGHAHHNEADDQRHAGAQQHAGENVAAQFIQAEPMSPGWPLQAVRQVLRGRIPRQQPRREHCRQKHQRDNRDAGAGLP